MTKRVMMGLVVLTALIFGLGGCGGGRADNTGGDDDFVRLFTLPDTGQTTCYNTAGTEISCAGTGQDGNFSVNPPSYTDNGNDTVTDNVTGLIWQNTDEGTKGWQAALDYCAGLTLGTSSNWRLPTRRELIHISDYGRFDPAADPVFNATGSDYWSASSSVEDSTRAWIEDFYGGYGGYYSKMSSGRVRCVQGDLQPEPVYTDNGDGSVTDESTGLVWQKTDNGTTYSWQGALDYCNNNTAVLPGSGWRLPNIKELESIVDDSTHSPASNPIFSAQASSYWSASSGASSTDSAWYVNFDNVDIDFSNKGGAYYVRCVRSSTIPTVTSSTGKVWMDKNLGASQVATAFDDAAAFGDLYQWGRGTDGHEKRDPLSLTTTTLSSSDTPSHGNFIRTSSAPHDWRSPQNDSLWQGVSGVNNPCPSGFRLPTIAEWEAERLALSITNSASAFASPLKLVSAGYRTVDAGLITNAGSAGHYWSSSEDGVNASYLYFGGSPASTTYGDYRASGFSARCLED